MADCREKLLHDIETGIANIIDAELARTVAAVVTKCLANYEVTERCTDLVLAENPNERILKRYIACLRIDGKSEKTVRQYAYTLKMFLAFVQKPLTEIGAYDIRYYLACEKDRGLSNSTIDNRRSNISALFTWMVQEELIPKSPCETIKPIKTPDVKRYPFTETDIDAMRSVCKAKRDRAILELLLSSGVRVSELCDLDITDLDFQKLSVRVRHGKGDKERITYMTEVAAKYVKAYLKERKDEDAALFLGKKRNRLTDDGVRQMLTRVEKRSGVGNVHPHRFRRTFASGLAKRGMDIQEIKELLGHSKLDTTMRYVCIDESKVHSSYRQYIA